MRKKDQRMKSPYLILLLKMELMEFLLRTFLDTALHLLMSVKNINYILIKIHQM